MQIILSKWRSRRS